MRFQAPTTLAALGDCLLAPGALLIAGGTDLLIGGGQIAPDACVIDLGRVAEMRRLEREGGALIIGAGVTVARLASDPMVREFAPALADAADQFGATQIRNRATIGGNVANASAAADLTPALVAMAAEVEFLSRDCRRAVPVADALAARPVVPSGSAILAFRIPVAGQGAFVKLGQRQEPTISKLTLAASGPTGAMVLVAGAIGPVPLRLHQAEAALNTGGDFAAALAAEVAAAIPGRASLAYKMRAVQALGLDLVARLAR